MCNCCTGCVLYVDKKKYKRVYYLNMYNNIINKVNILYELHLKGFVYENYYTVPSRSCRK